MIAEAQAGQGAAWTVHTEVFEGPLDLLLYLVERDGVDLRRLSVSQIATAYLAYLDRMRGLQLSLAAEYLVMAATLVHLKSLELLPRPPTILADEADPREALAKQLTAYAEARQRADALDGRPMLGRDVFARDPLDVGPDARRLVSPIDAFGLLELYHELVARAEAPEPVVDFSSPGPDMGAACRRVLDVLVATGGEALLDVLLQPLASKAERVVTFIGVLEMMRMRWVRVVQAVHLGPALVSLQVDVAKVELGSIDGWVEVSRGT